MNILFSLIILIFSVSISYSKNTDIIHDFKITFDCKLEKIMIKNKDFNYQTFTADNIEVDKKKVLKVVEIIYFATPVRSIMVTVLAKEVPFIIRIISFP